MLNTKCNIICIALLQLLAFLVCVLTTDLNAEPLAENAQRLRWRRTVFSPKKHTTLQRHIVASEEKPSTNKTRQAIRPRLNLSGHTIIPFDPFAFRCTDSAAAACVNRTALYADHILTELRRSLHKHADGLEALPTQFRAQLPVANPACLVMGARVRTLRQTDGPLGGHALGKWLPRRRLLHGVLGAVGAKSRGQRTCVVVASAGSLSRSGLGAFIDQHDIVMRFNHAPVDGYAHDVGRKTTIRVVNSQVVTKPEFDFVHSPMFRNISVAAWDPGRFNGTLTEWLAKPDFNLFDNYVAYSRQKHATAADVHLIDPRSIWQLWHALAQFTAARAPVQPHPPSSGFIGLALLMPVCAHVDLVEYVPSTRLNGRCHYYDEDVNPACTFGSWHPLAAEKLMAYAMSAADAFTTFQRGWVRVRRPRKNEC